jgi:predicted transcriptional regulator
MSKAKKMERDDADPLLEDEDEATLAAIDRGTKAADEGRVVSLEKVRQRMKTWLTKSSSQKTR